MTPDAPAADNSFLTIDQAVANLDAADERERGAPAEAEAAPTEGRNSEAEPAAEDASEPETVADGETAEPEDAEAEGEQPELPPIDPPHFWNAQDKDAFKALSRADQERIAKYEAQANKATAEALEKSNLARKAADGEASKLTQLTGTLDKLLPHAQEMFRSRWANVDWNAVVDQYGADQALKLRNQYEQEQSAVQQLEAAKNEAESVRYQKFVEAEGVRLNDLCPDLVDAKEGPQRREALGKFLIGNGVPAAALRNITALETSLAYDAMRWRNAQAAAKAKASAPPTLKPAAAKPTVKPTAAPSRSGSPQLSRLQQLNGKSRLTMDEAVERMDLMESLNNR